MSRPTPTTYRTRNWPAYNEALKRRGSLTIWFDPEMSWDAAPTGRRGRQQTFSDAAIQTCLSMKVLFGMALRQTTGFVESLLRLVDLDWTVPDFSTLSRRQKTLAVNIPYRGSKGPLHLLIDSTGIKVEGEGEWHARKHGGPKRRVWRKIHLGIDGETLEVRAVERSTGGKTKLGAVSKMGQTDIRRLLIVGAMSVIRWVVRKGGSSNRWLASLVARKPKMVAAVALANKIARMIWAVTMKQEDYRMA